MSTVTIRNIDDDVKAKLRIAAAEQGLSMEEHLRRVLAESVHPPTPRVPRFGFGTYLSNLVDDVGGIDLELAPRLDMPGDVGLPE